MKKILLIIFVALTTVSNAQTWAWAAHNDSLFLKNGNDSIFINGVSPYLSSFWSYIKGDISTQPDLIGALNAKQPTLISATNIKTINGASVLGAGDLVVTGIGASWGDITGTLSNQSDLQTALNGKQNTLTIGAASDYIRGDLSIAAFPTTTSFLSNSVNKNFVTDAQLTVIGSTSGTNSGDNAVNALYSGLVSNANHTGDATGSTALTLATVNSNVGSFTNANITVNAKGLITSASNGSAGGGPTFINLAANFSSTSTTPAAVTGWNFTVTTGITYRITVIAGYQTAATTTGGILGVSLTTATGSVRGFAAGSVSQSAVATELKIPIRATSGAGSTLTTSGVSVANSPHYIGLDITFTCTGSGTFSIVWGTEVSTSAAQLNQNSSLIYQALN